VIDAKSLLILANRKNPVLAGDVFAGEDQMHARMSEGARHVDFSDASVGMARTQKFAVRHAREKDVIGETRLAGYFCASVNSSPGDTNDAKLFAAVLRVKRQVWQLRDFLPIRHVLP
jgi:hypothetical protein